jgi:hypothetical protein
MSDLPLDENQIQYVSDFKELISTAFYGNINAICWKRELKGDFFEIVQKLASDDNIIEISREELQNLRLSDAGQIARDIILNDLKLLTEFGASPVLNVIKNYERDDSELLFPTDVYSFHVDRSPIPCDTFLCTYYGESSEMLPNSKGRQKVLIPEIREALRKLYKGAEKDFDSFLSENFYDLHYEADADAFIIPLGLGCIWRIATDYPDSPVLPCIHRAPDEKSGYRLLLIC